MSQTQTGSDRTSILSTPRWVKAIGIIVIILVLLVGIMLLTGTGEHGPGRHNPTSNSDGHTSPIQHGGQ